MADGTITIDVEIDEKQLDKTMKNVGKDFDKSSETIGSSMASKIGSSLNSGISGLKSGLVTTAKGIGVAMGAAMGVAGLMLGAYESTKEFRNELSLLQQNAENSGNSFDVMKDELYDVIALTGESDSAIEGLSNLMATGFTDNQAAEAVDALSGAIVKFPDTLKFETLADGLQETVATGNAVGGFSELLERSGVNLDNFNEDLQAATTTAERNAVALKYLADTGLADVNEQYVAANKNMLDAEKAQLQLTEAISDLGKAVEPTIALIKGSFANVLTEIINSISSGDSRQLEVVMAEFIDNIVVTLNDLIPTIVAVGETIIPALLTGVIDLAPELIDGIVTLISSIIPTIQEQLPKIIEAGGQIITSLVQGISTVLPSLYESYVGLIVGLIPIILEQLPALIQAGGEIITAIGNGIIEAIPLIVEQLPTILGVIITTVATVLGTLGATIITALQEQLGEVDLIGIITTLINDLFNTISTMLAELPTIISEFFDDFIPKFKENFPKVISSLSELLTNLLSTIIEKLPEFLASGISILVEIGKGVLQMVPTILKTFASFMFDVITTLLSELPNLKDFGISIIESIIKGIASMMSFAYDEVSEFFGDNILGAFVGSLGDIFDFGVDIVEQLWEGIKSKIGWVTDKVSGFIDGIVDVFKTDFDTHSPSKVLEEIGENVGEGLAIGISNEQSAVVKSATAVTTGALDEFDNFVDEMNKKPDDIEFSEIEAPEISTPEAQVGDITTQEDYYTELTGMVTEYNKFKIVSDNEMFEVEKDLNEQRAENAKDTADDIYSIQMTNQNMILAMLRNYAYKYYSAGKVLGQNMVQGLEDSGLEDEIERLIEKMEDLKNSVSGADTDVSARSASNTNYNTFNVSQRISRPSDTYNAQLYLNTVLV